MKKGELKALREVAVTANEAVRRLKVAWGEQYYSYPEMAALHEAIEKLRRVVEPKKK